MKYLIYIAVLFTSNIAFGQELTTKICHKFYTNSPTFSDTSLFSVIERREFFAGCSWKCNQFIRTPYKIHGKEQVRYDSSLWDSNSYHTCILEAPLEKQIKYRVYLARYSYMLEDDSIKIEDTSDVFLEGIILANGAQKSKKEYNQYSRLRKVEVRINNQTILYDTPKIQYVLFNEGYKLKLHEKIEVTLKIQDVYSGKQNALAISELQLTGAGGHTKIGHLCLD